MSNNTTNVGNSETPTQELLKLPTLAELYEDQDTAFKQNALLVILNANPNPAWIKQHKDIKLNDGTPYKYLPVDKIEYMLKRIFKFYKIEVTGQGTAFNGVWVTVRVHYKDPITSEWLFHDGIGACAMQTNQGAKASDMMAIKSNAVQLGFPSAKAYAIKDACDHFGKIFGSELNNKESLSITLDKGLIKPEDIKPLT